MECCAEYKHVNEVITFKAMKCPFQIAMHVTVLVPPAIIWLMPLASQCLFLILLIGSLARLSTLSWSNLLTTSIFIFVLCSVHLVEYTAKPKSMIEIASEISPQSQVLT